MNSRSDNLIAVGRIVGTHGIRGQLRLHSYSGNMESLKSADFIYLRSPSGETRKILLKRAVYHGDKILLSLDGLDTIELVQDLVGFELYLDRDQLPTPGTDEYYWHDLLELSVVTAEGQRLGTIQDILETGANDVYLVRNPDNGREYLIPAISSVIASIDLTSKTMVITPLDGLLEL